MKASLNHLPERKRAELARIVSIIRQSAPQAEMIILFGSYARGDWVQDVTTQGRTTYEYSSDFDILVIVQSKSLADNLDLWYGIEDQAGKLPVQTPVKIIAHELDFVNKKLEKGQYFFLLVYTNYKPKTHDLDTLRRLAANHDPAFFSAFPLRTKQERDRFDLLRQAYVGARYHDDYKITPQELKYLARCVELLRDQTARSCNTKMETFV